jgi:DNA-binding transcriptional regulator YhcF (GntR family)
MADADGSYERVDNNRRAQEQIKQDGFEATKRAVEQAIDKVVKSGFRKADVAPLIKEGAQEAIRGL